METPAKKKRRSDRNHIIYQLTNKVTGEVYIGLTVVSGKAYLRSLTERWKRHVSRALLQNHEWALCQSIRQYGPTSFDRCIVEVVRGKAAAHRRETQLIHTVIPELNSTWRGAIAC